MEIFVHHPPSASRAVQVHYCDRVAEYAATLSDRQLERLFNRIAEHTHLYEFGAWDTYAVCYPRSYKALRTLDATRAARVQARVLDRV